MSDSLNPSQMAMWSTLVSLVKADGKIEVSERKFIEDAIQKIPNATGTQKAEILNVFHSPQPPEVHFQGITESRDRGMLLYLARLVFYSDGVFCDQEQRIFDALTEKVMSKVDLEKAMHEVDDVTEKFHERFKSYKESKTLLSRIADAITFWDDYV